MSNTAALIALEKAIKFESDGRDFYLRSAETLANPLARMLFITLADDEQSHIKRVRELYEELKDKPGWPDESTMIGRHSGVLDIFEAEDAKIPAASDNDATQALTRALEMEKKGLAFYTELMEAAGGAAEKRFYANLVAEETKHRIAIEKALENLG